MLYLEILPSDKDHHKRISFLYIPKQNRKEEKEEIKTRLQKKDRLLL